MDLKKIARVLTDYSILKTKELTPYPSEWPKFKFESEECNMLIGPCACGAYHEIDTWWDRFGLEKPTFHSLKGTAISSGEIRQQ